MHPRSSVLTTYRRFFKETPLLVRSPGRVNLIGEHTDYNEGFVLPAAIEKAISLAVSRRDDGKGSLYASDKQEGTEFDVAAPQHSKFAWANYLIGVVDQLQKLGLTVGGFNCVFGGDIPIGAGLASSAAIEAGLVFALNELFALELDRLTIVKIAQRAENEFVGVQCGIMDQYVNMFGARGHVLRIDCRSLEATSIPFDDANVSIVLFNTSVTHSLAFSEYNLRRKECSTGVQLLQKEFAEVKSLRDVTVPMLESVQSRMDPTVYRRCLYVVQENLRLLNGCVELRKKNLRAFGEFMYQTHEGLRALYNVSCPELDGLVDLAKTFPQILGARMMGGGFGGCTINLVQRDAVADVSRELTEKYRQRFGTEAQVYITSIGDGTGIEKLLG